MCCQYHNKNSFNCPYTQVNLAELAPETYNLYSALDITVTASVTPFPSDHFHPFTTIHSITRFYMQIIDVFVHNLFPCFPAPASLRFQRNTFSRSHCRPFFEHFHTITVYFTMPFVPNCCLNSNC